jgi:hypothetical protein
VEALKRPVALQGALYVRHCAVGVSLLVEDHPKQVQCVRVLWRLRQDGAVYLLRLSLQPAGLVLHGHPHGRLDGEHFVGVQQAADARHAEAAHGDSDGTVAL